MYTRRQSRYFAEQPTNATGIACTSNPENVFQTVAGCGHAVFA